MLISELSDRGVNNGSDKFPKIYSIYCKTGNENLIMNITRRVSAMFDKLLSLNYVLRDQVTTSESD